MKKTGIIFLIILAIFSCSKNKPADDETRKSSGVNLNDNDSVSPKSELDNLNDNDSVSPKSELDNLNDNDSVSPKSELIDLGLDDLGVINADGSITIMLEDDYSLLENRLGPPKESKWHLKSSDSEGPWDEHRVLYESLKIYHFRGFNNIVTLVVLYDSDYQTLAGIKVGDKLEDIKNTYNDVMVFSEIVVVSLADEDDLEKGFAFELDSNGVIEQITLLIFTP